MATPPADKTIFITSGWRSVDDADDALAAVLGAHRFPTTAANLVGAVRCSNLAQAASAVNGPNVQHVPSWRSTSTTQYSVTWRAATASTTVSVIGAPSEE
ncbi:hypothetical protein RHA1_ro08642 (plasmid) [Rhodococcus jostii RHA1]|uniref:Uncharacterized protein n=1 Tax=Rhodococcus jostii (strain RHA1) TaxID=101510 RepID=Q0RYF0_RHOJR|nr:hypothetical protein RHA1_ro08642 [Rhodococcus jostii RHA1]